MKTGISHIIGSVYAETFLALEFAIEPSKYWLSTYNLSGAKLGHFPLSGHISTWAVSERMNFAAVFDRGKVKHLNLGTQAIVGAYPSRSAQFLAVNSEGDCFFQVRKGQVYGNTPCPASLAIKPPMLGASESFEYVLTGRESGQLRLFAKGGEVLRFKRTGFAIVAMQWTSDSLLLTEAGGHFRRINLKSAEIVEDIQPTEEQQFNQVGITQENDSLLLAANLATRSCSELHTHRGGQVIHAVPLTILPFANAIIGKGRYFVSGTREIIDCATGVTQARF